MNNRIKKNKFGSSKSQMNAMLKNLTLDLLGHGHVSTTRARAQALVANVERLFARIKEDQVNGEKTYHAMLGSTRNFEKIEELKVRFKKNDSGIVKMLKLGNRKGDGAELYKVMFSDFEIVTKSSKLKKVNRLASKPKAKKSETEN